MSVLAEGAAFAKSGALVQSNRRRLSHARFEAQHAKSAFAHGHFDPREKRSRDAAPPYPIAYVHPLDFAERLEKSDAAAPDGCAVEPGDEELDVRLEDRIER